MVNCRLGALYPSIMIEYGYLSRNVTNPSKYKEIRDTRLRLKAEKNPMQLPLKIVLNATYGILKDQYNPLFDPLMSNNVCVAGMLLLLDLIEKVEPYGKLLQSNTDGIFMKVDSMETVEVIKNIAKEWETRTRLDLEWEIFDKIYQKDVNNYIIIPEKLYDDEGKPRWKSKGAYVKKLKNIDYDLPIVNKALVNYFVHQKPIDETINEATDLREFQKIIKITNLYNHAIHNDVKITEKVSRVFASNDENDGMIYKIKGKDKIEKIANTPDKCFIDNDEVLGKPVPPRLNRNYYIDLANKRLDDFLNEKEETSKKEKADNLKLKSKSFIDECETFYEFLVKNKEEEVFKTSDLEILIKLDVLKKYGTGKKLINFIDYFNLLYGKKSPKIKTMVEKIDKDFIFLLEKYSTITESAYSKIDFENILNEIFNLIENEDISHVDKIRTQLEYENEISYINPSVPIEYLYVVNALTAKDTIITGYCINNGVASQLIIPKESFKILDCQVGDVIKTKQFERKNAKKLIGKDSEGKNLFSDDPDKFEYWLNSYEVIHR